MIRGETFFETFFLQKTVQSLTFATVIKSVVYELDNVDSGRLFRVRFCLLSWKNERNGRYALLPLGRRVSYLFDCQYAAAGEVCADVTGRYGLSCMDGDWSGRYGRTGDIVFSRAGFVSAPVLHHDADSLRRRSETGVSLRTASYGQYLASRRCMLVYFPRFINIFSHCSRPVFLAGQE